MIGKKQNLLVIVLLFITLSAVCVSVWAMFFRKTTTVLAPDYAPQAEEVHAEPLDEEPKEKLEQPSGGGAVSLTYSTEVAIDLSEEKASLLFANPSKSNQNIVLQIVVRDAVLVQSGVITPGNQVTVLDLLEESAKLLQPGGYEGKFIVLYYQQDTGEKAIVNTEIPISLSVNE